MLIFFKLNSFWIKPIIMAMALVLTLYHSLNTISKAININMCVYVCIVVLSGLCEWEEQVNENEIIIIIIIIQEYKDI